MAENIETNIDRNEQANIGGFEISRRGKDSLSLNDQEEPDGLTLKQAAFIYFGGLALLIGGMVVVGLST